MTNTVTRANVLSAIVNGDMELLQSDAAKQVAEKMLASITKPRSKSNTPSKTSVENAALLGDVLKILPTIEYAENGKPTGGYSFVNITAKVNGIMTTSKLGAVLKPAIADGTVIKYRGRLNGKTVTFYAVA
jgi:hypothetical protein